MKQDSVNASVMPKIQVLALSVVACSMTEAEGKPLVRLINFRTEAQMQDKLSQRQECRPAILLAACAPFKKKAKLCN